MGVVDKEKIDDINHAIKSLTSMKAEDLCTNMDAEEGTKPILLGNVVAIQ